ncbi:MAG: hypothetical protein ACI8ZM_001745 [Crocinitomix sp.]|jgi:hypothetical protein
MLSSIQMKIKIILLFTFIIPFQLIAQNEIVCPQANLSFKSTGKLTQYDVELEDVYGYENDNYAVDIEVVSLLEESSTFNDNIRDGAFEIANDMEFEEVTDGGKIPLINHAHYVSAYEIEEGVKIPVFIIAIIDASRGLAYEITVYCYDLNETEGQLIVNSFKLL